MALFVVVAWLDRVAVQTHAEADVVRGADSVREHALWVFQTDALIIALIDQRIRSMTWGEIATSSTLHDYLAKLVKRSLNWNARGSPMRMGRCEIRACG